MSKSPLVPIGRLIGGAGHVFGGIVDIVCTIYGEYRYSTSLDRKTHLVPSSVSSRNDEQVVRSEEIKDNASVPPRSHVLPWTSLAFVFRKPECIAKVPTPVSLPRQLVSGDLSIHGFKLSMHPPTPERVLSRHRPKSSCELVSRLQSMLNCLIC